MDRCNFPMEPNLGLRLTTRALKGSGSKGLQNESVEEMESGVADPPFAQVRNCMLSQDVSCLTSTHTVR
jgi:hypothetical protein